MHESAPRQKAKVVTSYLQNERIEALPWLGNCSDLKPIENLWKIFKDKVAKNQPISIKHVFEVITMVWVRKITEEYCQILIHSMPFRTEAVIKDRGEHTKY